MVKHLILLIALLGGCSPGNSRDDGGPPDADAVDIAETDPDGSDDDVIDGHAEDAGDIVEIGDPEALECILPIRDCGPGCRQITCAGVIVASWGFDIYGEAAVYATGVRASIYGQGIYFVDIEDGIESFRFQYPDSIYWYQGILLNDVGVVHDMAMDNSSGIFFFDLSISENRTLLSSTGSSFEERIVIRGMDLFGNTVVWSGKDAGDTYDFTDLFVYDLTTLTNRRLTENEPCRDPRIWENRVVCAGFLGSTDGSHDIILWNLGTDGWTNIAGYPNDQVLPDIWQDRVVWTDFRGTTCTDIYWCDLPDCEPHAATTNFACQDNPAVEGDWIAWLDFRNDKNPTGYFSADHDNIEIWGYHVPTGREIRIGSFNEVPGSKIKIVNGKLYFVMVAIPGSPPNESGSIFEMDLSQFL